MFLNYRIRFINKKLPEEYAVHYDTVQAEQAPLTTWYPVLQLEQVQPIYYIR